MSGRFLVLKFSSRYFSRALGPITAQFTELRQQKWSSELARFLASQRFQDLDRPLAMQNSLFAASSTRARTRRSSGSLRSCPLGPLLRADRSVRRRPMLCVTAACQFRDASTKASVRLAQAFVSAA